MRSCAAKRQDFAQKCLQVRAPNQESQRGDRAAVGRLLKPIFQRTYDDAGSACRQLDTYCPNEAGLGGEGLVVLGSEQTEEHDDRRRSRRKTQACAASAEAFGYSAEDLASIPAEANIGPFCGNPLTTAGRRPGDVVVNLGCGNGLDVFLQAKKVAPKGKAIGNHMMPEMLELARRNSAKQRSRMWSSIRRRSTACRSAMLRSIAPSAIAS